MKELEETQNLPIRKLDKDNTQVLMPSSSYVFPKVHKSKKIIEKINESSNICTNMQLPEDMKVKRIIGGSNSSTEGISGLLEKLLSPIVSNFKKIYQG